MSRQTFTMQCPVPVDDAERVLLAHGGGGTLMQRLIDEVFAPAFRNAYLDQRHDGAVLPIVPSGVGRASTADGPAALRLAMTTDSYVVSPLTFPGGDIGTLAVNGTVNDLAMCGAKPLALSAGFILEEGLPMQTLRDVVQSMRRAAEAAGVSIVTGDTKVVDRGRGDGMFINTAGIGLVQASNEIGPRQVRPGDALLVNGDLGRHGVAIMAVREGLSFEGAIESDCASLWGSVAALLAGGVEVHCLRDATRGGLATALVEIAETAGAQIDIREDALRVQDAVRGACELLGLDPLYVANEGRFIVWVRGEDADKALDILRRQAQGAAASIIGRVANGTPGLVTMTTMIGARRVLDRLQGEQLPRIC